MPGTCWAIVVFVAFLGICALVSNVKCRYIHDQRLGIILLLFLILAVTLLALLT